MLGDKAYDSAELREDLHERRTKAVIPNRCNRKQPFSFNKRIYKLRWRIDSTFNRLKDFRRIATRASKQFMFSIPPDSCIVHRLAACRASTLRRRFRNGPFSSVPKTVPACVALCDAICRLNSW
jgi:transposase